MRSNRVLSLALCLGVIFLTLVGSALAGTTTAADINYARELGALNVAYTIPAGNTIVRNTSVIRSAVQDFFVDLSLTNSATFGADITSGAAVTVTGGAGVFTVTKVGAASVVGTSTVRFFVDITTAADALITVSINTSGFVIRDVAGRLITSDNISATVNTVDSATNLEFDSGANTDAWLDSVFATNATRTAATTAIIDVATGRLNFLASFPDTLTAARPRGEGTAQVGPQLQVRNLERGRQARKSRSGRTSATRRGP
jgi:hypothetical protein